MSKLENMSAGCAFFAVLIAVAAIFGEIRCIYQFFTSDFEPSYKREIVYGAATITGLGSVVGYLNIHDTPTSNTK